MRLTQRKRDDEALARLTAAKHASLSHFSEHRAVEGFQQREGRAANSDRLLEIADLYGSVQLGYDPGRAQSFLFVRVKTSVYDTAASAHQRGLSERQMRSYRKRGNENRLFTARRRRQSAALFYKAENEPWTLRSMRPYLRQPGAEALLRTMPFLDRAPERARLEEARAQKKALEADGARALREKDSAALFAARAGENGLWMEQNRLAALVVRKDQAARLFFRRINYAFDIQKARMFDYYRELRARPEAGRYRAEAPAQGPEDTEGDAE